MDDAFIVPRLLPVSILSKRESLDMVSRYLRDRYPTHLTLSIYTTNR